MPSAADEASALQAEVDALNVQYQTFIEELQVRWLQENNTRPQAWRLYELDAEERQRVDGVTRRWGQYITPIAENWWKERGFGIVWPETLSETCKIYKLHTEPTAA